MFEAITWQVVVLFGVFAITTLLMVDELLTAYMKKWEKTESNRQKIRVKEQQATAQLERELAGLEAKR